MGFVMGKVSPCHLYHKKWDMCGLVHGEDFVFVGHDGHRNNILKHMSNKFKVKVITTGRRFRNELRVLNRRIPWTPQGTDYEGDHRHADRPIDAAGVTTRHTVATPAILEPRKASKGENGTADADRDQSEPCVWQASMGRTITPHASVAQRSVGRGGSKWSATTTTTARTTVAT